MRKLRRIGVLLAAVNLAMLTGCGGSPETTSIPTPSEQAATARVDSGKDTEAYKTALVALTQSEVVWGYEPRVDVKPSGMLASVVVFGRVEKVERGGRVVDFDATQLYLGPSAFAQARRDAKVANDPIWIRNRFRHIQEASLTRDCVIVGDPIYWQGAVVEPSRLKEMASSSGPWFWIVVGEGGRIEVMVHLYAP